MGILQLFNMRTYRLALNLPNSVDNLRRSIPSQLLKVREGVTTMLTKVTSLATANDLNESRRDSLDFLVIGRGESKESPAYKCRSASNRFDVYSWYYYNSLTMGN